MESWYFLAIAAMIGYGIQNFFFRIASGRNYNSLRVNTAAMIAVTALAGILYIFSKPVVSGPYFIVMVIGNGLTYLFSTIFRIESFKFSSKKIAAPIASMYVAITPVIAFYVFKERLTLLQGLGLALATLTLVLVSEELGKEGGRKKHLLLGIAFAGMAAVASSFNNIIGKSAAATGDLASFILFSYLFSSLTALILQATINKDKNPIVELIEDYYSARLGLIIGAITFFSYFLLLKALTTGPASQIIPIVGLGLVITVIASAWHYKNKISIRTAAGVIVAVAALVFLG